MAHGSKQRGGGPGLRSKIERKLTGQLLYFQSEERNETCYRCDPQPEYSCGAAASGTIWPRSDKTNEGLLPGLAPGFGAFLR